MAKPGSTALVVSIGLAVGFFVMATMLPAAIGPVYEPVQLNFGQEEGEKVQVKATLYAEITNISDTEVTVNLTDESIDYNETITVPEGGSTNVTIRDVEVTVSTGEYLNDGDTSASMSYIVPNEYGWTDGAGALYKTIPIFGLLIIALILVRRAKRLQGGGRP